MTGDVTVIGLQPVTCILDDITMDVPHGTSVVIPAEKAARSKDLWRAISQRLLFRLDNGLMLVRNTPKPLTSEVQILQERIRVLEEENRRLQAELDRRDASSQQKLDSILAMLQSGSPPLQGVSQGGAAPRLTASEVVEVAPPPFIPSQIRSEEPMDAHVQAETGSTGGANIAEATSQLRRFRQRGGQ